MLLAPRTFTRRELLDLLPPGRIEELLRIGLERTGFFGARFRENAGRALLLPRGGFGKRLPLWLNRLRSKKLLDAVMDFEDFPILLETWRTCLRDEFDIPALKLLLDEVREGEIAVTEVTTAKASPFAEGLIWQQTNDYMYRDDTPDPGARSRLGEDLLREVAASEGLRPEIPPALAAALEAKLRRTAPGYAPAAPRDLLETLKERLVVRLRNGANCSTRPRATTAWTLRPPKITSAKKSGGSSCRAPRPNPSARSSRCRCFPLSPAPRPT